MCGSGVQISGLGIGCVASTRHSSPSPEIWHVRLGVISLCCGDLNGRGLRVNLIGLRANGIGLEVNGTGLWVTGIGLV